MSDTNIGQQRLNELTAGHPLAVARLRAMYAVIDAASPVFSGLTTFSAHCEKMDRLRKALRDGGWIK